MTNHYDKVKEIAYEHQGMVTTKEITYSNIPRRTLSEMVEKSMLVREGRGIYYLPDAWSDEWMMIQYRYAKGIYSHETALFLHGYTDRTPAVFTMTFPRGYHRKKEDSTPLRERFAIPEIYEMGIEEVASPAGSSVRAYNLEKTLCDLLRGKKDFDIEIVNAAMKRYAQNPERNPQKMMRYAKALKVEAKVRNYLEVLL